MLHNRFYFMVSFYTHTTSELDIHSLVIMEYQNNFSIKNLHTKKCKDNVTIDFTIYSHLCVMFWNEINSCSYSHATIHYYILASVIPGFVTVQQQQKYVIFLC